MQDIRDPELPPETSARETLILSAPARGLARLHCSSPALRQTFFLFGATRALLVLVTYFGYVLFNAGKYSAASVGVGNLLSSWDRWDALRYLEIANHGYHDNIQAAFFPLYPLLIRLGSLPFGGAGAYPVGLVISNIAFFFALWALRVLAERECGPEAAARAAVYLAFFPTSLYFFAPYNESLFVLLTVGCFLALRRGRWWLAGGLGLLAALTRSAGIVLVVPFAVEYLSQHGWQWRRWRIMIEDLYQRKWQWQRMRLGWLAACLIPAGLALYIGYDWLHLGHPLAFEHAQAGWGRALHWPWSGLWDQLVAIAQAQPASFFQAHDLLDLMATLMVMVLVVLGWRRLPLSYNLYAMALLATFLLFPQNFPDALASNQRFVLEVFPAFLTLGLVVRRPATHQAIMIIFSGLLAVLTLLFITGRWLV
jgi:hypothetical protein